MAAKPVKPKPAKSSLLKTKAASLKSEQVFVDPLADVPSLGSNTDRFTIQPGEIEFITVGSIEVVTHPSGGEEETKPTTPPAGRRGQRPKGET